MNRQQIDELLAQIRATRESGLAALEDLGEDEFALSTAFKPWRWDTLIRVLLQFGNHMREHAVQVEGTRAKIERLPSHPQRVHAQAEVAWGLLLASLVGLSDEDLDAAPPDGGWSIRQVLEHIRDSEQGYLDAALLARKNAAMEKTVNTFDPRPAFEAALTKMDGNLQPFATLFPDDTTRDNVYYPRRVYPALRELGLSEGANIGWTTSFWTGQLWLAYEWTGKGEYRQVAEGHLQNFAERLERQIDTDHHDLGFLYSLAAVAPWKLTQNIRARQVALQAAETLMKRYIPAAGIFQAWGRMDDPEQRGRAIIDCLMNMPLLYWASQESGDPRYAQAAESHALKSMHAFIRPDDTTFHTFYFDLETGAERYGKTAQGAQDDSCWARGQAWGIYGFPLSYRYTRNAAFLQAGERLADYFLAHLPADRVAYWDLAFGDGSGEERDSSASAIAACGLLELAHWMGDTPKAAAYRAEAVAMTRSLYEHYSTRNDPRSNAQILHGVYSKPGGNGVDEANLWGDYFYVEALMRLARPAWLGYW